MSEWPMVKLGEVADFINGAAFKPSDWSSEGRPIIRIQNLTNPNSPFNRTERKVKDLLYVDPGDLLVSWSATLGVFRWTGQERAVLNQHIFKVVPKSIDNVYLEFGLRFALQQIEKYLHGATMRHINRKEFLNLTVPLPPLGEQKRIAEILGKTNDGLFIVESEIKNLDRLQKSIISNFTIGRKTTKLENLATLSGGLSLGSHRKNKPLKVDYLRVANVFWGKISYEDLKTLNCTEKELKRTLLQNGDIVITEAHANRLQVGRSAIIKDLKQALTFQNHLFRVRPNNEINSEILAATLGSTSVRKQLYQMAKTTSGLNTISISQVRSLQIPILDDDGRQELLEIIQKLNKAQHALHQKLAFLQELQRSLSARAFAGDL